jgi:hypothetical protein
MQVSVVAMPPDPRHRGRHRCRGIAQVGGSGGNTSAAEGTSPLAAPGDTPGHAKDLSPGRRVRVATPARAPVVPELPLPRGEFTRVRQRRIGGGTGHRAPVG